LRATCIGGLQSIRMDRHVTDQRARLSSEMSTDVSGCTYDIIVERWRMAPKVGRSSRQRQRHRPRGCAEGSAQPTPENPADPDLTIGASSNFPITAQHPRDPVTERVNEAVGHLLPALVARTYRARSRRMPLEIRLERSRAHARSEPRFREGSSRRVRGRGRARAIVWP